MQIVARLINFVNIGPTRGHLHAGRDERFVKVSAVAAVKCLVELEEVWICGAEGAQGFGGDFFEDCLCRNLVGSCFKQSQT